MLRIDDDEKQNAEQIQRLVEEIKILEKFNKKTAVSYLELIEILIQGLQDVIRALEKDEPHPAAKFLAQLEDYTQACPGQDETHNHLIEEVRCLVTGYDIIHPTFSVPKEILEKKDIQWEIMKKPVFRGDRRGPDEIFKTGFHPRENGELVVENSLNSNTDNVVPFSSRFRAAMVFPYDKEIKDIYVYVFVPKKVFDVHRHGYNVFVGKEIDKDDTYGFYVDELITDKIEPEDIIAAVKVSRVKYERFLDLGRRQPYLDKPSSEQSVDDKKFMELFDECGEYILHGYVMNPNCTLPQEVQLRTKKFIEEEIAANKADAPTKEDKYNYLLSKKTFLKEKGIKGSDLKQYKHSKLKDKTKLSIIRRVEDEVYDSWRSARQLPLPTSGYAKNAFFKKQKKSEGEKANVSNAQFKNKYGH